MKNATIAIKVDDKGRLTLPSDIRKKFSIQTGDIFFMQTEKGILRFAKAQNPFDILAAEAVTSYQNGKTKNLRDIAKARKISLDDGQ